MWPTIRSAADLDNPEQRRELPQSQVGAPIRRNQKYPTLQRQRPGTARPCRIGSLTPQLGEQLPEGPRAQPCDGAIQDGSDAVITLGTARSSQL